MKKARQIFRVMPIVVISEAIHDASDLASTVRRLLYYTYNDGKCKCAKCSKQKTFSTFIIAISLFIVNVFIKRMNFKLLERLAYSVVPLKIFLTLSSKSRRRALSCCSTRTTLPLQVQNIVIQN